MSICNVFLTPLSDLWTVLQIASALCGPAAMLDEIPSHFECYGCYPHLNGRVETWPIAIMF